MAIENPHHYSTTSGVTTTTQISDDIDYPHSGLIKALSQGIRGNYAIKSAADCFDITLTSSTYTQIAVASGKAYRDGKLVTITQLNATNLTGVHATEDVYQLLVAQANNTMALRGSNSVTNRIPDLTDGDIPIAVIKLVAGSAQGSNATTDRLVQFLTTSKVSNDLSIGYDNSGAYTETANISGASGVTTITAGSSTDVKVKLAGTAATDTFEVIDSASQVQFKVQGDGEVSTEGLLHSGGNIKVGGNVIQASDGGSTITMDTSDNVTIGGGLTTTTTATVGTDLTVTGGDINLGNGQDGTINVNALGAGSNARNLTITSGNVTAGSGTANRTGGDLTLSSGAGSGTGTSKMIFKTAIAGSSGTSATTPAERMRIHTDGKVGIGTASPSAELHIEAASNPTLRIQETGQTGYLESTSVVDSQARIKAINNTASEPVTLDISPVTASTGTEQNIRVFRDSDAAVDGNFRILRVGTTDSVVHVYSDKDGTAHTMTVNGATTIETDLKLSTSSDNAIIENVTQDKDIIFQVNDGGSANTEVMRIDGSTSRVGIGETSPDAPLHITYGGINEGLILESTDADQHSAPDLILMRNSSSPADNDVIGNVQFRGRDSASNEETYASILAHIVDKNTASEDAGIKFYIKKGGSSGDHSFQFVGNTLSILEQASADSVDGGGRGRIWVKDDAPNNLYFTNDADDDIKLSEEIIIISLSDETTDLTTGNGKASFNMPFAMTLTKVKASVNTAPTGASIIVDVNEAGSTIFSSQGNRPTIAAGGTSANAAAINDTDLADNALITFDIDQIGSSDAGKGLKVTLYGYRTS